MPLSAGRGIEERPMAVECAADPESSLIPAFSRIREMAKLPTNWDREGAKPPTPSAVAAALYLIEAFAERRRQQGHEPVPPATSSPIPDGGLQLEWKGPRARIDVQANPAGSYGFLVKWGSGSSATYEEADEAPLESVLSLIDRVLAA
jgi:hypothetical protein